MFKALVHADWSTGEKKKWMATAERTPNGWSVTAPQRVASPRQLLDHWLFSGESVLAGFDFPIGLPTAFGKRTGFANFPDALAHFGVGEWEKFFEVSDRPEDISVQRPFYPNTSKAGHRRADLLRGLGVNSIDELLRACERKTSSRAAACSIFWTLGGNQVGKAAIDGWRSVVRPSVIRGARLWPFDGTLSELSVTQGCVLCETYPREAYDHVGVRFLTGQSKRNQAHRRAAGQGAIAWAERVGLEFMDDVLEQLADGFGPAKSGEDPFDAFIGLLGMIEVVDGRRNEGVSAQMQSSIWEGWILGQRLDPLHPSLHHSS